MTSQINFWNPDTYKGQRLGSPGTPLHHGGVAPAPADSLRIGLGHSLADALVALLSDSQSQAGEEFQKGQDRKPWEVLEAILHGQVEAMLANGSKKPLDRLVHQAGYWTADAGQVWRIKQKDQLTGGQPKPDGALLAALSAGLKKLNEIQDEANVRARRLSVLQQDLYAAWWMLCRSIIRGQVASDQRCSTLKTEIRDIKRDLADSARAIAAKSKEVSAAADKAGWVLLRDGAPRFWAPADPVVVISNLEGGATKAAAESLPCRTGLAGRLADDHSWLRTALSKLPLGGAIETIAAEALVVEEKMAEAIRDSLPATGKFGSVDEWKKWLEGQKDFAPFARYWKKQPWLPLFLDWEIRWQSITPDKWRRGDIDYSPVQTGGAVGSGTLVSQRSLLMPMGGEIFTKPINELLSLIDNKGKLSAFGRGWKTTVEALRDSNLVGQALTGFHQCFLGRDPSLPRIAPDSQCPWVPASAPTDFKDAEIADLLAPVVVDPLALAGGTPSLPDLAPPATQAPLSPGLVRAGISTIERLRVVDRFGQWVDLKNGAEMLGSRGVEVNARSRGPNDTVAAPPRIVQPCRVDFRFAAADMADADPIGGWVFYNRLDRALAVCDSDGHLLGELCSTPDGKGVEWLALDARVPNLQPGGIARASLRTFVEALLKDGPPGSVPRLQQLLQWISTASASTAPPQNDNPLIGWPLVLVEASLRLELFGPPLADGFGEPRKVPDYPVHVRLGELQGRQDGLICYSDGTGFSRFIGPAGYGTSTAPSPFSFIADPTSASVDLTVGEERPVTLLLAPQSSVQVATGVVPTKSIQLDPDEIRARVAGLEYSFRIGPVLVGTDRPIGLPLPAGVQGEWQYQESRAGAAAERVVPLDPKSPNVLDTPRYLAEGRLVLRKVKPGAPSTNRGENRR